jgi:hypothetical protein
MRAVLSVPLLWGLLRAVPATTIDFAEGGFSFANVVLDAYLVTFEVFALVLVLWGIVGRRLWITALVAAIPVMAFGAYAWLLRLGAEQALRNVAPGDALMLGAYVGLLALSVLADDADRTPED